MVQDFSLEFEGKTWIKIMALSLMWPLESSISEIPFFNLEWVCQYCSEITCGDEVIYTGTAIILWDS